jgi:hypothetical protein
MHRPPRWKLLAWGIPSWAIVALVWVLALQRQPRTLVIGLAIGFVGLAVFAGAISAWVAHNRRLARRREAQRGGRRGAPAADIVVTEDARGRPVRIAPGARDARVLVVQVENGEKVIAGDTTP